MKPRVFLAEGLIKAGRFIQSLAIMVMRPRDLVEFSRRTYSKPQSIQGWTSKALVESGLLAGEKELVEKLPVKGGRLLLLGVGGGREAIPLGRMGFEITGVDFVPALVQSAEEAALREGIRITGAVQEISRLDWPSGSFDVVWLSAGMFSSVPTKKRRAAMLAGIKRALKPGGYFVCQYMCGAAERSSPASRFLRKGVSFITLGNFEYEKGDRLASNIEFVHYFSSADDLNGEFLEAGFDVVFLDFSMEKVRAGAILKA